MSENRSLLPPLQKSLRSEITDRKEWTKILKSQQFENQIFKNKNRSSSLENVLNFSGNIKIRRNSVPFGSNSFNNLHNENKFGQQTYTLPGPSLFGDQKLFLQGSQMLETLAQMLQQQNNNNSTSPTNPILEDCQFKKLYYYHEKLKLLLREQCLFNLKKECIAHIQTAEKFVTEIKEIVISEYKKLKYVSEIKLHGNVSSIHESGIYLGSVRSLIEMLGLHIGLWPSLLRSFGRALNILNIGWNPNLDILLTQTHKILQNLEVQALFWIRRILDIDFSILCAIGGQVIPSDILQNIFQTLQNFNKLLRIDKNENFCFCHIHLKKIHKYCSRCKIYPFSFLDAIQLLANYEAKTAAKRLALFLSNECKKLSIGKQEEFKWKPILCSSKNAAMVKLNNTSDYFSASFSDAAFGGKTNNATMSITISSETDNTTNINRIINELIQINQTILLKFLFAFACVKIQPDKENNLASIQQNNQEFQGSRQIWQIPTKLGFEDSTQLERTYWHHFWHGLAEEMIFIFTNFSVSSFILKTDSSVPLSLSSVAFQKTLLRLLKDFKLDGDVTSKSIDIMKKVHDMIYTDICIMAWDERICATLSSTCSSHCVPIPLIEGAAGTNQGNLICTVFEPLIASLLILIPAGYYSKVVKISSLVNSTSDYAIRWANNKRQIFLSCWNIPLYLLISCSDLELMTKILQNLNSFHWYDNINDGSAKIQLQENWNTFSEITSFLENIGSHIFKELNHKSYLFALQTFKEVMPSKSYWKRSKIDDKGSEYIQECVKNILESGMTALSHLSCKYQMIAGTAIMEGFSKAWLDYIWNEKIKFSHSGGMQLCKDIDYIINWLNQYSVTPEVKQRILTVDHIRKLIAVSRILATSHPRLRRVSLSRNRVSPIVMDVPLRKNKKDDDNQFAYDPDIEDDEREEWQNLVVADHYFLPSCFCCFE